MMGVSGCAERRRLGTNSTDAVIMQSTAVCTCVQEDEAHLERWRDVCRKFYFHQDPSAKTLLDAYEQAKQTVSADDLQDAVAIEIADNTSSPRAPSDDMMASSSVVDLLGLTRCPVRGHGAAFDANLLQLETIKTRIRGDYHAHLAHSRYEAFHCRLNALQSCQYHLDPDTRVLAVRPLPTGGYLRRSSDLDVQRGKLLRFLGDWVPHMGTHPFLHGLRRMLDSSMHNSTVVGWQVSDAVFVESGGAEFADAAASLLVDTLQCGHVVLSVSELTNHNQALERLWVLDPYMSNAHIRRMMWLFPAPTALEGRATGTEVPTVFDRYNAQGQHDEAPAWRKVCIVL